MVAVEEREPGNRGTKVSTAKAEYMFPNAICPTDMGHRIQISGKHTCRAMERLNAEVNKMTKCGWNNWRKMLWYSLGNW